MAEVNKTVRVDMTLNDFKMMKIESLRDFLTLRNKPTEGDFETLACR